MGSRKEFLQKMLWGLFVGLRRALFFLASGAVSERVKKEGGPTPLLGESGC